MDVNGNFSHSFFASTGVVPEPATATIMALGLLGAVVRRRRGDG